MLSKPDRVAGSSGTSSGSIVTTSPSRVSRAGDEVRRDGLVAGHDEDPRRPRDQRRGVGPVVLGEGVPRRLDDGPEDVEAGLLRGDVEDDPGDAGLEVRPLRGHEGAVGVEADGGRLGDRRADLDRHLQLLAEARRRRHADPVDQDLVRGAEADRAGRDLDPPRARPGGLHLAGPGRVVAVREEDDPLLRRVREEGGGQAQRSPDVGGAADRRGGDPVEVRQLVGQALHERVLAERDDPGDVPVRPLREGLTDEGQGLGPPAVADGVGEVDDEDRGQPVDRAGRPPRRPGP